MRVLAIGLAIAVIVFVVSGGHVLFLPLLFLPLGLFSLGHRRRRQPSSFRARPIVAVIWMFLPRVFRRFAPLWLGFMAYRYWRRLSPERKAALKKRMRGLTARMRGAPAP